MCWNSSLLKPIKSCIFAIYSNRDGYFQSHHCLAKIVWNILPCSFGLTVSESCSTSKNISLGYSRLACAKCSLRRCGRDNILSDSFNTENTNRSSWINYSYIKAMCHLIIIFVSSPFTSSDKLFLCFPKGSMDQLVGKK